MVVERLKIMSFDEECMGCGRIIIAYDESCGYVEETGYMCVPCMIKEIYKLRRCVTKITPDEYQSMAILTENRDFEGISNRLNNEQILRLLHSAIGLSTEAGELLDALKKHIFYGKELDITNILEEYGDAQWYIVEGVDACGSTLSKVMLTNIEKLKSRYPNKFRKHDAIHRDLDIERKILEK